MDGDNLSKYDSAENELDEIYDLIAKAYELEANVTGMNMAKNRQIFFEFRKITMISKHNKKLAIDDKEITEEIHNIEHIREFYETLFKTWEQRKKRQKWKI